jgi:hypothetical protein
MLQGRIDAVEPGPHEPCPCGRGKESQTCCLTPAGWYREPQKIIVNSIPTGAALNGCVAARLKDCSPQISREHIIPRAVLNAFEPGKTVTLEGMHFLRSGSRKLSKKSAVANVTCERHNNIAAPLDSAFAQFFLAILGARASVASAVPLFTLCSGPDIERALLRLCILSFAAGWNRDGNHAASLDVPTELLEIVWCNREPSAKFDVGGLHVVDVRHKPHDARKMAIAWDYWIAKDRNFIGFIVWIAGISFAIFRATIACSRL